MDIKLKEEENINFLVKQYKKNLYLLKEKEKKINFRNKISPLFFIFFLYNWGSLIIVDYYMFNNSFLGNVLTLIFLGINVYVYILFGNAFLEEAKDEYEEIQNIIDSIKMDIDTYLEKNKYDTNMIEEFYKNISDTDI